MATRTDDERADLATPAGDVRTPEEDAGRSSLERVLATAVLTPARRLAGALDGLLLAGALALLIWFLQPGLLLSDTTPAAGDTGAHVYVPWFLREHLFKTGNVTGWSQDWFGGFPVLHFYFPLIPVAQALLGYVIPENVAFKLVSVVGPLLFPACVYAFFRLVRFRWPLPAVGVVLAIRFLFLYSFINYGGNLASSLVGEYSFSLSLGLSLVWLGLAYRLATENEGRPVLAAVVLGLAALSHLVPIIGLVVPVLPFLLAWAIRRHGAGAALRRFGSVIVVGVGLSAFWAIPFVARLGFAAELHVLPLPGWDAARPSEMWIYIPLLPAACLIGLLKRDRRVLLLSVPAIWGLLLFGFLPEGSVWNARFLPFWFLGLLLCAAYVGATVITVAAAALKRPRFAAAAACVLVSALALEVGYVVVSHDEADFVRGIATKSYRGYENAPRHETFRQLMNEIEALPPGRVMWEPSLLLQEFGSIHALMTTPYWTGHPTYPGLYVESSISSPFVYALGSEVGDRYKRLPDWPFDSGYALDRAVPHMRALDISYLVTTTETGRARAEAEAGLTHVADVDEVSIYSVGPSAPVVVPRYQPVVLEDNDWIDSNLQWFARTSELEVPLAADGPPDWPRVGSIGEELPRVVVGDRAQAVDDVSVDHDRITFTTEAVGEPHWVKTSFFPNWRAEGAEGPYLASPSMMLVVPTQETVTLSYTRTWAEWLGLGWTGLTLLALVVPRSRRSLGSFGTARRRS